MNKYKVSELAEILGVSEPAIRKKLKRGVYNTVEETINNRKVTLIKLDDNELSEMIEQAKVNKTIHSTVEPTYTNRTENVTNQINQADILEKIIELSERYNNNMQNVYEKHSEQIAHLNSQVLLLEDSEKRKDNEYLKQIQELRAENQRLHNQLENVTEELEKERKKPFWKRNVI